MNTTQRNVIAAAACLLISGCSAEKQISGVIDGHLGTCPPSPNCVSTSSPKEDERHYIDPITFTGSYEKGMRALRSVVTKEGGEIVSEQEKYLHVIFRSQVFGFIDDAEYLVDDGIIHIRSAARSGWYDFGVNRKRAESIREALTQ